MVKCARRGCGKEYDETDNTSTSCCFHSGAPVFHEGLKSWSCCSDVNKPVLDFDSFMAIPGCTEGPHTQEKPTVEAPTSGKKPTSTILSVDSQNIKMESSADGRESFSTTFVVNRGDSSLAPAVVDPIVPAQVNTVSEEEEDFSVSVPVGTPCKRVGCGVKFVSEEINRMGDGEGTICKYHPAPPLFREGSKGYLCCKKRVLEFEEFLKIAGCKTGRHLFAPKQSKNAEELVRCRIDHYQTLTQVHVSIYAKETDKDASCINLEESKIHIDIVMPASKRFRHTVDLYGPIDPHASKVTFLRTKVELALAKTDTRSWPVLEKTHHSTEGYNLTFGVRGTGTVGGKEMILSQEVKSNSR